MKKIILWAYIYLPALLNLIFSAKLIGFEETGVGTGAGVGAGAGAGFETGDGAGVETAAELAE